MATEQQKRVMDLKLKAIESKAPIVMGDLMLDAGYSKKAAEYPKRLIKSKGWQELLNEISDIGLLNKLKKIAMDDSDKRACLEAIDKLLKLKDRYPAGKIKLGAFEERDKVLEQHFRAKKERLTPLKDNYKLRDGQGQVS